MAAIFRQKEFGKIKEGAEFLKKNPALPISAASLGIAGANLKINTKRQKEAKEIAEKQLDLMNKQMNAISDNTKALKDSINSQKEVSSIYKEDILLRKQKGEKKEDKKSLFRIKKGTRKLFSIKSATIAGAQLGLGIGTLSAASNRVADKVGGIIANKTKFSNLNKFEKRVSLAAAGAIIGAALGALVGSIDELSKKISRTSVNKRLLPEVISNLKKDNLREGIDYTRDPNIADRLKLKVCIAISKYSGNLRILINTKSDSKLKEITNYIIKHIPNTGVETKTANNKFNEITISTISDSSADATLVSGIAEQFIHQGFPVYLVEVG